MHTAIPDFSPNPAWALAFAICPTTHTNDLNTLINDSPDDTTPQVILPTILLTVSQWCNDSRSPQMSPQPQLATLTMIDRLPCPIPGCHHACTGTNRHFPSKSTLLQHLNHDDHQATFHLADQSICTIVDICSCTQQSCPTAPTRFFRSLNELTQHNALHHQHNHPPPPTNHHSFPPSPSTLEHLSSTLTVRMGLITYGTLTSPSSYKTPIITPLTSEPHGAVSSNTASAQTSSAFTSPRYPSHHQCIYTLHQLHPLLVGPLPP